LTEDIWQNLPVEGESIMIAPYPESDKSIRDEASEEAVQILQDFITGIRNLRSEMGIVPSVTVTATVVGSDKKVRSILEDNMVDILRLARLDALEVSDTTEIPQDASTAVVRGHEIFMPFPGSVDVEAERDRIGREIQKVTSELEKVQSKLSNAQFLEKAPSQVVQKNRDIAEELRTARDKLKVSLERLSV
ncbi:MAG: class I tRNA ligase family protein, partial [bacterium]